MELDDIDELLEGFGIDEEELTDEEMEEWLNKPDEEFEETDNDEPTDEELAELLNNPTDEELEELLNEPEEPDEEEEEIYGEPIEEEEIYGEPIEEEEPEQDGEEEKPVPVEEEEPEQGGEPIEEEEPEQGGEPVEEEQTTHSEEPVPVANEHYELQTENQDIRGHKFKLEYINLENIIVIPRIRANKNTGDLEQSIKSTGLLEPLVVAPMETKGTYLLVHGFRRLIACARTGIKEIPCIVNSTVSTSEISILEAIHNHHTAYSMVEMINYIEYLEKEKGILSGSTIEYLLQMKSGDYAKLKDILEDDDEDIISDLLSGKLTIEKAFKKLEKRRKDESAEEQQTKKANKVYSDTKETGMDDAVGTGEEVDDDIRLSEEEIAELNITNSEIEQAASEDLDSLVKAGNEKKGFEPKQQDYKNRERLDPALRKAVLVRDENKCQCCGLQGQEYNDVFDVHHKVEVYLGGSDVIENLVTVCTVCHRLIHSWARGALFIRPETELEEQEAQKFKRIIKLGNIIRDGMERKGIKKEELKKLDNAERIGRTKPGTPNQQAT